MMARPRIHLLVPLLALGLTLGMTTSVYARDNDGRRTSGTSGSIQITFGSSPRWSNVSGTSVRRIHEGDRTNYDMFRYGHSYYVYNNADSHWYMSQRSQGRFMMIDDRSVPMQIRRLPREHWRNYPTAWDDRNYRGPNGSYATMRVGFNGRPQWMGVNNTGVEAVYGSNRPNYDVFRYGGKYYAYNNDRWYSSPWERGEYTVIDDRSVPTQLSRVPREQWRNYPSAWDSRSDQGNNGTSATFSVSFGNSPRWTGINGTRVEEVYGSQRPGYDIFRYGGNYYAHDNDRWYTSSRESGQFTMIDDNAVPNEFRSIPRDHWRNYPTSWDSRGGQSHNGTSATLSVSFGSSPRWTGIHGTRVEEVYGSQRPGYDIFRYGGSYYAHDNDRWYRSSRESGQFMMIDDNAVPNEFRSIPRDHWRNYPQGWQDQNGDPRWNGSDQRDRRDRNDQSGSGGSGN